MTCGALGIESKIVYRSQTALIVGSDYDFTTKLFYKGDSASPVGIDGFIGATGYLKRCDGTIYAASGELISEDLGTIKFDLPAYETSTLAPSEETSFEYALEDSFGIRFFQFESGIKILPRFF